VNAKTSIIIPAYNEEEGLPIVLDKLVDIIDKSYEVVVVDDGSVDGTSRIAVQYPFRLVEHGENMGKGNALRTGIRVALGESVVWLDADDTYPVEVVPQIAEALEEYDMVVCPRVYGRENVPRFNRIGNWLFRTLIRRIYGFKGRDVCSGLCGVRREYLLRMGLISQRFAIEPEVCMKGARMGLRLLEIPIEYRSRVGGTKLNVVKAGLEDLLMILRLVFWRPKKRKW